MINKLRSICCLASDMDGTLLDGKKQISEKNRDAIAQFVKAGGIFTFATGRMEKTVRPYVQQVGLSVPAILYNGAKIYDFAKEQVLWEKNLPFECSETVRDLSQLFADVCLFLYQAEKVIVFQNHEYIDQLQRVANIPLLRIGGLGDLPQLPLTKVVLHHADVNRLEQVKTYLQQNTGYHIVYSHSHYLEILPSGVSKGAALRIWSDITNISLGQIMAIGDNMNDLEMLQTAGYGVAVANAHPDLKQAADHITVSHEEHAVAALIEKWINR